LDGGFGSIAAALAGLQGAMAAERAAAERAAAERAAAERAAAESAAAEKAAAESAAAEKAAAERAAAGGGNAGDTQGLAQGLAGLYTGLLGREIQSEGAEFWSKQLASGMPIAEVRDRIIDSEEFSDFVRTGVPAFADGGMHAGGMRIVGERGPELEATGSSKLMSNAELMSSLGGNKQLAAEMKSMHSDMMQGLNVIAKNTNKGSKQLERWDLVGLPKERSLV